MLHRFFYRFQQCCLLFLLLSAVSCGNGAGQSGQTKNSNKDRLTEKKASDLDSHGQAIIKPLTNSKEIRGIWKIENKKFLTVKINKDSIYYLEHFESYKYKLKGDSILISYPDFLVAAKVYFQGDTMFFESEEGKSSYVRFKQ